MANQYGFEFLKAEHLDESATSNLQEGAYAPSSMSPGSPVVSTEDLKIAAERKPALEKQFDIMNFLKAHREKGPLPRGEIYTYTGIDLDKATDVASLLRKNPKIQVEGLADPENPALTIPYYSYIPNFPSVKDRTSLLAQINRESSGVSRQDLLDSYSTVKQDIERLVTAGDIIAVEEDKGNQILFPRGEPFLVELDGSVSFVRPEKPAAATNEEAVAANADDPTPQKVKSEETVDTQNVKSEEVVDTADNEPEPPDEIIRIETDVDPLSQIRRGEAIWVGGQWFRVSTALKKQKVRSQPPLTVSMMKDLGSSDKNEAEGYIHPFDAQSIPLAAALEETAQENLTKAQQARERLVNLTHGRSGGVKDQLLGSHAHASNPTLLAASLAGNSAAAAAAKRKRPTAKTASSATTKAQPVSKEELEKAAADRHLSLYRHARRHGCTKDVRDMYLATRDLVPESDEEMRQLLVKHKLMEPNEQLRLKRIVIPTNRDEQGKPKKKRYYERKDQRLTNLHLEGTEIGNVLGLALEKQKQGQSVGDGGM